MLNHITVSGRVFGPSESKQFGEHTISKITLDVPQLKKIKGEWVHQTGTIEVKGWNKTAEKIQRLSEGQKIVVEGKLEFDLFEYQGSMRQKVYVSAFTIHNVEAASSKSKSVSNDPQQTEIEEPIPEDDIPF